MQLFRVRSGALDTVVRAVTHKTAAIIAVNKTKVGVDTLISVLKKGDPESDAVTFSSAKVLEDMGCEPFTIEDKN